MIIRPKNWNEVKDFSDRPKLPLGAYVCKVKKAAVQNNGYGDQLCILFDIAEGDFKGYYKDEYDNNQQENKKWKGVLRVWLPKDDGSDKDEWTKRTLKGFISAFEKSNPGFTFNWDENALVGKYVGILYRNEEWEYNGKFGWAVRPNRAISADSARNGDYRPLRDKPLKNKSSDSYSYNESSNYALIEEEDSELPF
jgi:hypothetical protein